MFELWKEALPEFADAYFMTSGPVAGARESRRIVGEYVLTGADVRQGRMQDDVIVLGAWRLDRHPADKPGYHDIPWTPPYAIPYRTLLPQGVDNLLVAGRCHSATAEALASSRGDCGRVGNCNCQDAAFCRCRAATRKDSAGWWLFDAANLGY
jgi:hypothetical protein